MNKTQFLIKLAQDVPAKRKAPPHTPATMEAYPDYSKSLVHQRHADPVAAGITRGLGTGLTGAALGALVARIVSSRPEVVGGGALAGGALGAGLGYNSGKREADSEYSKLLFLRRRMGINEPGEHEALMKHPALAREMIDKQLFKRGSVKQAMSPAARAVVGVLVGAGAGWGLGTEGMSRIMGYREDPGARHMGGAINAANLAVIGGLLGHSPSALAKVMKEHIAMPASMVGMELLPSAKQSLTELSNASKQQAEGQVAPTLGRIANSSAGRGAGVGAGLAGLAAVASGLTRGRSDKEIGHDTGRVGMIGKDFAKYVLPAAAIGGVAGSLHKRTGE